jgi:hypothetical protein
MTEFNESEIKTAEKQTIQQNSPEWSDIILKAYEDLPAEFKRTPQDLKGAQGKTSVLVTYMPFGGPPIGSCRVTIYTATGPRHPVGAEVEQMTIPGQWTKQGTQDVNNFLVGAKSSFFPEITRFTFECPFPPQYWEIHIQTPVYSPLPNFLDSMIGSCEPRGFVIQYPGVIARMGG